MLILSGLFVWHCLLCATTVFTEGRQVWGGDQGSYRQAEGGEWISLAHWFFESVMLNTQYRFLLESFCSYKVLAVVSNADLSVWITNDRLSPAQAETRAEFAERSVAKLEKTIDDLEGMNLFQFIFSLSCRVCSKCDYSFAARPLLARTHRF